MHNQINLIQQNTKKSQNRLPYAKICIKRGRYKTWQLHRKSYSPHNYMKKGLFKKAGWLRQEQMKYICRPFWN